MAENKEVVEIITLEFDDNTRMDCEIMGICWLSRPVCYTFVTAALGGWSTGAEVPHLPI